MNLQASRMFALGCAIILLSTIIATHTLLYTRAAVIRAPGTSTEPAAAGLRNASRPRNTTTTINHHHRGPRILCWVLTDTDLAGKTAAVRDTWTRRCDKALFMSSAADPAFPMIGLNTTGGLTHIAAKAKAAWTYIYQHHFHGYDYFMKADPDTYVIVENLKAYLRSRDPREAEFFGHRFKPKFLNYTYMSGGPGLVISRTALRRMVVTSFAKHKTCIPDGRGEDYKTAGCMLSVGAKPVDTRDEQGRETFLVFKPIHLLLGILPPWYLEYDVNGALKGKDCCSAAPISFHYFKLEDIMTFEYIFYGIESHFAVQRETNAKIYHFMGPHKRLAPSTTNTTTVKNPV